jgi:hypothetical protein|tara:strand:- start:97 stop:255 length:159 start_codon:yes stop_codon:yes gene_type:complete
MMGGGFNFEKALKRVKFELAVLVEAPSYFLAKPNNKIIWLSSAANTPNHKSI